MSFDGVFIRNLIKELKTKIINARINKVNFYNKYDFSFSLSNKQELLYLLSNNPRLLLTKQTLVKSDNQSNFSKVLKKLFEKAVIMDIYQIENDRIIVLEISSFDDLGYEEKYKLIFEAFGRNYNLIIVNKENKILEILLPTSIDSKRILLKNTLYEPMDSDQINPYKTNTLTKSNNYQGISQILFQEIQYQNDLNVINNEVKPVIIDNDKTYFYCFDLKHLKGNRMYFSTLSKLLESYFQNFKNQSIINNDLKLLSNHLDKELAKLRRKKGKQEKELEEAYNNLEYEQIGNILKANLYQIKKGMSKLTTNNFYTNKEITIKLDPLLSPSQNLDQIFKKYKKAKRSIDYIKKQIEESQLDILYYEDIQSQLDYFDYNSINETILELGLRKITRKDEKDLKKPKYTTYILGDDKFVYLGKNNYQNSFVTHKLANKDDYFFHVKDYPGSHVVLRGNNLLEDDFKIAANFAAYFSKAQNSSNVAVIYTQVKNVNKIAGQKGSFVKYKNEKTIFVTPNKDLITRYEKKGIFHIEDLLLYKYIYQNVVIVNALSPIFFDLIFSLSLPQHLL